MSVTSFFEKFVGLQQQRAQTAIATYRDLVAGIATGEEPNPAEVERLLPEAGMSLDDLRRDVEHFQHRMALKAAVAAMPAFEAERSTLEEKIAAANKLLEAAEKQHRETTRPLYLRLEEVKQGINQGTDATMQLVYTCEAPDLRGEMDSLDAEYDRLSREIQDLEGRAFRTDRQAQEEHYEADHQLVLSDTQRGHERAKRTEQQATAMHREVSSMKRKLADLDKQRTQLEQRMRKSDI